MKDLKKIELHLHLEGAAPPAFIRGLAAEKNMDLPPIFDAKGHYIYRDFNDFLRVYEAATAAIKSPPTRNAVGNVLPLAASSHAPTFSSASLALKLLIFSK